MPPIWMKFSFRNSIWSMSRKFTDFLITNLFFQKLIELYEFHLNKKKLNLSKFHSLTVPSNPVVTRFKDFESKESVDSGWKATEAELQS